MTAAAAPRGCTTPTAVARWGRDGNHLPGLLGLTTGTGPRFRPPCAGELSTACAALDGTCRRGPGAGAAPGARPVSAFDRDAGAVPAQVPVGGTNEATAAPVPVGPIPLGG